MTNIEALCRDWLDAKRQENAANKRRIEVEEQMAQALDVPDEGSKTHKLEGFKVTVTQPVERKLDEAAWAKNRRVEIVYPGEAKFPKK